MDTHYTLIQYYYRKVIYDLITYEGVGLREAWGRIMILLDEVKALNAGTVCCLVKHNR